jgi:hypothetical protein
VANADQAVSQGDALGSDKVCPVFEPCGGSVVGTWYLSSECRAGADPSSCFGGYNVSFDRGATIVYTFNADGTFKVSAPSPLRLIMRYPLVCLGSDAGAAEACSDYQNRVQQSLPGLADAGTSTSIPLGFTCQAESDQACLCSEDLDMAAVTVTGNYSVSGNTITTTGLTVTPLPDGGIGDAGAGELAEYCISGNALRYRSTSGSGVVATMTK